MWCAVDLTGNNHNNVGPSCLGVSLLHHFCLDARLPIAIGTLDLDGLHLGLTDAQRDTHVWTAAYAFELLF